MEQNDSRRTCEEVWDDFLSLDHDDRVRFLERLGRENPHGLATALFCGQQSARLLDQDLKKERAKQRQKNPKQIEKIRNSYEIEIKHPEKKLAAIAKMVDLTESQLRTYRKRYKKEAPRPHYLPPRRPKK